MFDVNGLGFWVFWAADIAYDILVGWWPLWFGGVDA